MSRPFTGKTHTGIRHITRPNGDVYVYERVTQYDPQAKKTQTLKTTLCTRAKFFVYERLYYLSRAKDLSTFVEAISSIATSKSATAEVAFKSSKLFHQILRLSPLSKV